MTLLRIADCNGSFWPRFTPTDFRHRMERVLSYRSFGPADVWGEVREWLEERGVTPADDLPKYEPRRKDKR